MTTPVTTAGALYTMYLNFYNEQSGALTDPSSVQLDITFGSEYPLVPDYAGPFTYSGASGPGYNTVYRIATGQYAFLWQVPANAPTGAYVSNWSVIFLGDTYLITENFVVQGGIIFSGPSSDVGFWTASMSYQPVYASSPLTISLGTGPDSNGISWLWQQITGWDSPPVAGQVIQRSADHGGWPASQYYGPRIMTITAMASAPTQALRDVARAELQQIIPVNDLATLTYNEPQPKVVYFRRSGQITETYPTLLDAVFTCNIVCPDPRKYSTTLQTLSVSAVSNSNAGLALPWTLPFSFPAQPLAGSLIAVNNGTFETRPVVTVTGPITEPSISNVTYGMTVSFSNLSLAAGDVLELDMDTRTAFLNGVVRIADLDSAWWVLQPGSNDIQVGGTTTGGSLLTVSYRDAWI